MKGSKIGNAIIYIITALFGIFCLVPMLLVIMVSFTSEEVIKKYGYSLFPKKFSVEAYRLLFSNGDAVVNSYKVTIFVTIVGTLIAVAITGMAAYTLINKEVKYRNSLSLFFFIPMVFNGGIVPWYLICTKLGLKDSIMSLIIPNLIFSPFNLFLVRNFMKDIPDSLMESAKIDGASDPTIAFKIYFPLSMPVLATVALFYGLGYWNDWWNAIMLVDEQKLYPLQYLLFKLQSEIQMLRDIQSMSGGLATAKLPSESLKMATAVITVGPIVFLYPFLQRYFVKGLTIGSVKG